MNIHILWIAISQWNSWWQYIVSIVKFIVFPEGYVETWFFPDLDIKLTDGNRSVVSSNKIFKNKPHYIWIDIAN